MLTVHSLPRKISSRNAAWSTLVSKRGARYIEQLIVVKRQSVYVRPKNVLLMKRSPSSTSVGSTHTVLKVMSLEGFLCNIRTTKQNDFPSTNQVQIRCQHGGDGLGGNELELLTSDRHKRETTHQDLHDAVKGVKDKLSVPGMRMPYIVGGR